jgi:hypothetical protein
MLFGSKSKGEKGREFKDDFADNAPEEPLKGLVLGF